MIIQLDKASIIDCTYKIKSMELKQAPWLTPAEV